MNSWLIQLIHIFCMLMASTSPFAAENNIEEVVVTAHPLSGEGLSQAVDVLQGEELQQKLASNIGATLAKQPGVQSASFGNAVGRPVIHGLSGPRVRIMEDRIDTLDVSVTSADHAVSIEPFIAERIEIFKGPSSLLYGSGALGGVVDVHTARIPHAIPTGKVSGGLEVRFDDNTDGNTSAVKLNGGHKYFAWHLDATIKDGNDYKIPGPAKSKRLRALEGPETQDEPGYLPGSRFKSRAAAAGASFVDDWGFFGIAVSTIDSKYGLPGAGEESGLRPRLELQQVRTDFELALNNPFAKFSSLNIRIGQNDYEHQEIEPDGEVATEFNNDAWEARLELVYDLSTWSGAIGFQYTDKALSAIGEEAFMAPVDTSDGGVFWVAEREFGFFNLEVGARVGRTKLNSSSGFKDQFTTGSASVGIIIPFSEQWQLGINSDYSSRSPAAEELYSNGPHLVTNTFEQGNINAKNESATNLSATIEYRGENWSLSATGYYTHFFDFIYQQLTGEILDDLPVVAYRQDDATYKGVDLEFTSTIFSLDKKELRIKALFDTVSAKLKDTENSHLPRIPALRYGLGLEFSWNRFNASANFLRVNKQDKVAYFELITSAYTGLGVFANFKILSSDTHTLDVFLNGKNLSNHEQRAHTSFIKDFAPAPGRAVEAGIRWTF